MLIAGLALSCSKEPYHLSSGEMEDVLYDFHLAQSMAMGEGNYIESAQVNTEAMLRKHGISREEFDSSLVYYMRHADELHVIYQHVSDRLSNDALAFGASMSDINRYGLLNNDGDTANVWAGEKNCVLIPVAPYNKMTFRFRTDSTYKRGDKLMLNLRATFLYQEGAREAVLALHVRYDNDSVASRIQRLSANASYSLNTVEDIEHDITEVSGYVYLFANRNSTATSLKLFFADDIQLIRFHMTEEELDKRIRQKHTADSIHRAMKAMTDSLRRASDAE